MTDYRSHPQDDSVTHCEQAAFSGLSVVDVKGQAASVTQEYQNAVVLNVNDHCVRLAVMQGEFRWHQHPHSDECFLVIEGQLEIDLVDGRALHVRPGEACAIPAGVIHRTRSLARAVILCFEHRDAYTDVVFEDVPAQDAR